MLSALLAFCQMSNFRKKKWNSSMKLSEKKNTISRPLTTESSGKESIDYGELIVDTFSSCHLSHAPGDFTIIQFWIFEKLCWPWMELKSNCIASKENKCNCLSIHNRIIIRENESCCLDARFYYLICRKIQTIASSLWFSPSGQNLLQASQGCHVYSSLY